MSDRVREIKKARGCAAIYLESGDKMRVPQALLRERPLHAGDPVDPGAYQAYVAQRGFSHALDRAVKLLSLRDHSEGELRLNLQAAGYPEECIQHVLAKLYEHELVDDQAFAENWVKSRAHKHGRNRITMELTRRGVSKDMAHQAAAAVSDEDQLRDAVRLTEKYLARTHGDFDRSLYQRTLMMLARHGYDAEIAKRAIRQIAEGAHEDDPSAND